MIKANKLSLMNKKRTQCTVNYKIIIGSVFVNNKYLKNFWVSIPFC